MADVIQGVVWKFGDNVSTDYMSPGFSRHMDWSERKKHVMHIRAEFASACSAGDLVLGGSNFGCGSARQSAPANLKELGIACVLARSFARIFYRNCIAIGLPAVAVPKGTEIIEDQDSLVLDLRNGTIDVNGRRHGDELSFEPLSAEILAIIDAGGILETLRRANST